MPGSDIERIADRANWRDVARTGAGAMVAAGAVTTAALSTSNSWPLALIAAAAAFGWPASRWRNLAKRQVVAEFDRQGVRLYPETSQRNRSLSPVVDLPWAEVRGIYFWRRRTGLYWTTMVGVEPVHTDPRQAADRTGVPAHVTSPLARRSVAISASDCRRFEAVARRFSLRAKVTDYRGGTSVKQRKVY
ncbi:hypothetical protein [Glycomyces dulcitolivorans]|uniref:hypothetical protein n=1 Tax=Glycomyces dulcitolivorans TaxID=2200759 RepID=UPI000DD2DFEA|nr:hypothetical protein [Glycomyces dulcitolivorans]